MPFPSGLILFGQMAGLRRVRPFALVAASGNLGSKRSDAHAAWYICMIGPKQSSQIVP
ncbi:MAG: hypothetical protein ACJAUW_000005 [Yoonia sp.]|jgi:hypothetical protein